MLKKRFAPLAIALCASGLAIPAYADDAEVAELKRQMQAMMQRLAELEAKQTKIDDKVVAQEKKATEVGKAVQVYGQLRLSADSYSSDFGTGQSGGTVKSNASRFGIKGEIPTSLDGTSMIYQAEVQYGAADNVANEIVWREGFAGLKGGWGQARLGRIDVPYKTTLTTIDPWNDNAPQSRGFGGVQGSSAMHSSYFTNTAEYISPSWNGVKLGAWVSQQLDGETSSIHDAGPITNYIGGDAKGLGVKFDQGPWFFGADWIDINADKIGASTTTLTAPSGGGTVTSATSISPNTKMHDGNGWQVAGRYKASDWSVAAFYEDTKTLGLGTNAYLNGSYKLGKTTLIATYGQNHDATQFFNRNIDTWSLGAKYALTKDSELFAAWVDRSEEAYISSGKTTPAKDYQLLTLGHCCPVKS
jgi:hypothetical protein